MVDPTEILRYGGKLTTNITGLLVASQIYGPGSFSGQILM